jgi:hypothetical protein
MDMDMLVGEKSICTIQHDALTFGWHCDEIYILPYNSCQTESIIMGPETSLPLPPKYTDPEQYIEQLIKFCSTCRLWDQLCGSVHILDFFTRDPDLYAWLLPADWRAWFELQELDDLLDFFLREELSAFGNDDGHVPKAWRGQSSPPQSLLEYVRTIRDLSLDRSYRPPAAKKVDKLPRHVSVGMNVKKVHEVSHFSQYLSSLCVDIAQKHQDISHLVDFGSGQNYLGRALACSPHNKHVIAVESKKSNIEGSRRMDVHAKLAPKEKPTRMINKKEWKKEWSATKRDRLKMLAQSGAATGVPSVMDDDSFQNVDSTDQSDEKPFSIETSMASHVSTSMDSLPLSSAHVIHASRPSTGKQDSERHSEASITPLTTGERPGPDENLGIGGARARLDTSVEGKGSVQYVEHRLQDGDLTAVIDEIVDDSPHLQHKDLEDGIYASGETPKARDTSLMVMVSHSGLTLIRTIANLVTLQSIHSCGNLSHHGLRSITLNPDVTAVAIVGCCYNLVTEKLTRPSYKLPGLRPAENTEEPVDGQPANSPFPYRAPGDPHGYPMSERLTKQMPPITLNITARMMAVQAPANWTKDDSESFFTRHYYRALLQRVFLDRGCIDPPPAVDTDREYHALLGGGTAPIVIGSLRKKCYEDFASYVRGAVEKIARGEDGGGKDPVRAKMFQERMAGITDEQISAYDEQNQARKKEVSIVWSLMAYSANLVEAIIVVDRWMWLREQDDVAACWVEAAWEYEKSPRNLVVVGVKKRR